jgi:hypothetical protein
MKDINLIDRYVVEVGNHLPKRIRADVQLELRSALHDAIEERGLDANDEAQMTALLKEYGPPAEFAARYQPAGTLIGPAFFPIYKLVLTIALSFVTVVFAAGLALDGIGGDFFAQDWWGLVSQFINYAFINFGIVTLVFAVLERTAVRAEVEKKKDWNPRDLPKVNDPDRIDRGDMIFTIVFSAAAIVVFKVYPQWIGFVGFHDGEWGVVPVLTAEFLSTYVPWLSTLWALEIGMRLWVLNTGAWTRVARFFEFMLSVASIALLNHVIQNATVVRIATINLIVKGGLWIALIVAIVEAASQLVRLFFPRTKLPWRLNKSI